MTVKYMICFLHLAGSSSYLSLSCRGPTVKVLHPLQVIYWFQNSLKQSFDYGYLIAKESIFLVSYKLRQKKNSFYFIYVQGICSYNEFPLSLIVSWFSHIDHNVSPVYCRTVYCVHQEILLSYRINFLPISVDF